ncbi:MAG TPA: type II secretion system protein GspM [Acidocella sp.]|jgi:general secretion pathway protein M|uniref:type II secretion system protein GspM n=1 Tax=Acidocella sp. TaxID=50710 RepID=UPI002CFF9B3E|nr:type II secretion system protein GspM [Acidocella sp.]HVE20515.1 type II secretion system protein GspM [Acidocella sp.]
MNPLHLRLPDGRRGQILALGIGLAALLLLWVALLAPLFGWYQERADELAQQRVLAVRMQALAREIPTLRAAVAAQGPDQGGPALLLQGDSDAIAGANLQSALQDLATRSGTSLDSAALAPVQAQGPLRKLGLQVSLTASWPALISFLASIETASPRMIVGGLSLSNAGPPDAGGAPPVQASFTVSAFRAAGGS